MTDRPAVGDDGERRHLDATGPREVVYCHHCDHEWYQDQHGLICPECESESVEIVTPDADPRPHVQRPRMQRPPTPPGFQALRGHNPWNDNDYNSDPEEADIEEHIRHGPGGAVIFTQTVRRSTPLGNQRARGQGQEGPDVMQHFQSLLNSLVGPGSRPGQPRDSVPHNFMNAPFPPQFPPDPYGGHHIHHHPHVMGGRFTFNSANVRGGQDQNNGPPVEDLATVIGNLFGPPGGGAGAGANAGNGDGANIIPPGFAGLQGLFAALLNPANARAGDAVYTQEALDQIISTLMDNHATSNAPGPAPADAIAALPKKKLDEEQLGPEGKGECSVCMDDVKVGDEVVFLPCSHWFHEGCASAWLSSHNTCPICRKGINDEGASSASQGGGGRRANQSGPTSRNEHRARRLSATRPRLNRDHSSALEARLDALRTVGGRLPPTEEQQSSTPRRNRHPTEEQSHYLRRARNQSDRSPTQETPDESPWGLLRRTSEQAQVRTLARRTNTSGSEQSRESRRSSNSGSGSGTRNANTSSSGSGNSGGGLASWIRGRFSGSRQQN